MPPLVSWNGSGMALSSGLPPNGGLQRFGMKWRASIMLMASAVALIESRCCSGVNRYIGPAMLITADTRSGALHELCPIDVVVVRADCLQNDDRRTHDFCDAGC
jgi:hypothetical protein